MTRIDFYSNAAPRIHVTCQLTAKAFLRGMKVVLLSPDEALAQTLDRALWTFQSTGFLPHCRSGHQLASETPVLIALSLDSIGFDELLINMAQECPPGFGRFQRLIEIVGEDETARESARTRWRYYRERGYLVNHVDLARDRGSQRIPGAAASERPAN